MAQKIRRVITGLNAQGQSTILFDDHNGEVKEMASMPGVALTDLWETTGAPADNSGSKDAIRRPVRLEPLPNGSILRVVEFPPDTAWLNKADAAAAFASIGAGTVHDSASSDPMRHKTATIDYIIVIKGEIHAVVDTGSVLLKQGDIFVQRGTVHSWSVKGNETCLIAAILINAVPI